MSDHDAPEWTVEKLISAAQAFDKKAARHRNDRHREVAWRYEYPVARRLAFTARKFARAKLKEK